MITSLSNPKIKNVTGLISSKKERMAAMAYVVEGTKTFLEAPENEIREVYISESFNERLCDGNEDKLAGVLLDVYRKLKKTGFEIVADSLFKKMSDTVTPQGIICVMDVKLGNLSECISKYEGKPVKVIALEGLQDPGNMGTIVRTAEAAGINFILAGANTVDVFSSKVVRSTMGSIFRVPIIYTNELYKDIDTLKSHNISVYAAHLKGNDSYSEVKYDKRALILIGNEGRGLTDEATNRADVLVKIPMQGQVESLNASVAAALLMFELRR